MIRWQIFICLLYTSGPDLSAIGQKLDARTMIDAIINPAANIAFGYELTTFKTKDKNYFGFLVGDGNKMCIRDKDIDYRGNIQIEGAVPDGSTMLPSYKLNNQFVRSLLS